MSQPTPPRPTAPAEPGRGLLGHLAGVLPRRRMSRAGGAAHTPGDPFWDLVRGEPGVGDAAGRPDAVVPSDPAGTGDHAGTGDAVVLPDPPRTGSPLARADGWLAARSGSRPPGAAATDVGGTAAIAAAMPGAGAIAAAMPGAGAVPPVRVPAWPAWVAPAAPAAHRRPGAGHRSVVAPSRPVPPMPTGARPSDAAPASAPVPASTLPSPSSPGDAELPASAAVVRVSARRPAPAGSPAATGVPTARPAPPAATGVSSLAPASSAATGVPTPHPAPPAAPAPAATGAEVALRDGRRLPLSTSLLVGRNPAPAAGECVGGLVVVDDPGRSVSKTHLAVGIDRAGAWVVDRHSTNGTVVTLPDGQRILCVPGRRVRLVTGARVHFGDHGFTLLGAPVPDGVLPVTAAHHP